MASTVNSAFKEFMKKFINLDKDQVALARASRDWLIENINNFPSKYDDFPTLYEEKHFGFGSFARSTKKRPLDDIDYLICMNANGVTYNEINDTVYLNVPETSKPFNKLLQTEGIYLSSRKIINRIVKYLNQIHQYEQADINLNHEAATLKLKTYDWNFDIVPCFFTAPDTYNKTYYIIPDGSGNWKKTDPTLDKARTTRVNKNCDGNVLQVIRAMKYWNKRPTMPTMESYLLENMILDYYESNKASQWIDWEVKNVLLHIKGNIFNSVNDPKNIQGDINTLTWDQKTSIYIRANNDYNKAVEAVDEEISYPASAISKWGNIFGPNFPIYKG